jgi:hypothetical protein
MLYTSQHKLTMLNIQKVVQPKNKGNQSIEALI